MFENLKAFIRHGKHANEKHSFDSFSLLNLPKQNYSVTRDASDQTLISHHEDVGLPTGSANDRFNQNITTNINHNLDETMGIMDPPTANNSSNNYHYDATEPNHHEAATHIVEEERVQKKKLIKYPNLDNYEVMEQLGEGAFSVVYRALNLQSNREVAIKILRKFQMDQAQKLAVLKEVTIMRQLNHRNVVRFIEFIDSEPYYYIVQELVSGGEIFAAIVKYTYLSENLSRHIIVQVAQAVRYLHEEVGIVHRDIKPENLLYYPIKFIPSSSPKLRRSDDPHTKVDEGVFTPGVGGGSIGLVKLADFGLSKQIWEHNTKTPCGTVGYTAPEIVRDERYSKEVDMWAIGCVLYTLLCGFPPFYDERIDTLTEKVAKGEFTFLSPWWDEISREAKHCVSKLLTVDPKKRYTIDEFLADPWITQGTFSVESTEDRSYNLKLAPKNYDPAAVALREAFDITTAMHRIGEEAKLTNGKSNALNGSIVEEEEEEELDENAISMAHSIPHKRQHQDIARAVRETARTPGFELNLGGALILGRRKNKALAVPS